MAFRYIGFIFGFLAFVLAPAASAETIGPELFISSKGGVHIKNAELGLKNALNLFSVTVWGVRWGVNIDRFTVLESADGKPLPLGDFQPGHLLEIKGRAASARESLLNADLVRDLSLGVPLPPSGSPRETAAVAGLGILPPPAGEPVSPAGAIPAPTPQEPAKPAIAPPAPPAVSGSAGAAAGRRITGQLKLGMRGGEVAILQEFLQKGGWGIPDNGPVTGYFGRVTENAVKKFQAAQGLPPEGEVGPKTRALINELLRKEPQ